jgi:Cellulose binding domain
VRRRRYLALPAAAATLVPAVVLVATGQIPASASNPHHPAMDCMALYDITSSWTGGFVGEVTVMNHNTEPIHHWQATWKPGLGQRIVGVWHGRLHRSHDGTVTVRNSKENGTIGPDGAEVTFRFLADSTRDIDYPIGPMACTGR